MLYKYPEKALKRPKSASRGSRRTSPRSTPCGRDRSPASTKTPRTRGGPTTSSATRERGKAGPNTCRDRKSTRLNSSHGYISYAVFCLKKKKTKTQNHPAEAYAVRTI